MTFQEELEKAENEYIKEIGNYLVERAKIDPSVARNLEKENKSLKKCFQFIIDEAKKQKQGSCAMVKDDVVFGWAVHYYDEDNLSIDKKKEPKNETVKTPAKENIPKKTESPQLVIKKEKHKSFDDQLSLF